MPRAHHSPPPQIAPRPAPICLGFGHGMSEDWANWGDEAAKPVMEPEPELQSDVSTPAPTPKPGSGDGVKPAEPKVKRLTAEERMRITQENIDAWLTSNQALYTLLEQELKDSVDAAVEKAGKLLRFRLTFENWSWKFNLLCRMNDHRKPSRGCLSVESANVIDGRMRGVNEVC